VAFVVAPGLDDAGAAALMDTVNAQLVPYNRIREVVLVPEIPVSAAGKVLKRELRERFATNG
jgi:long-chain acyl-CoA synthetase